ncbi:sphingomyelin phosphodiesterase [Plakobranchus ocellatus]|uniref:Sphingomyelin phosphodiesterase n=1 Tax=Plakobranchus ocellatus TaxID=259542 RepID=A0AAV3Y349_9GAST|nr:sphingomyelin phosphodiesterase [Plakobranchus ocellatus]
MEQQLVSHLVFFLALILLVDTHSTVSMKIRTESNEVSSVGKTSPHKGSTKSEITVELETKGGKNNVRFSPFPSQNKVDADAMLPYLSRERRTREQHSFLSGLTCELCELIVAEIRAIVQVMENLQEILSAVTDVCAWTRQLSKDICRMIVYEYRDQIVYIFNHLVLSPKEVCGIVLGKGCASPYYPGQMWYVKLPETPKPPPKPPVVPKPDAPKVRVLQLTDIHIDPLYEKGTKSDCGDPLCCRSDSNTTLHPCATLEWLIGELQSAEDNGEKVHLLLHIPPGSSGCLKAWSWNFFRIVNRYENTVVNQFYGHEHRDYFHLFLDGQHSQRPFGVGFAAPSVTSYSSTNPAYRIYTVDGNYKGSSWVRTGSALNLTAYLFLMVIQAVLDYTTYYLNITEANIRGQLVWKAEYSPKKDFKMSGLYANDWADLVDRMEKDDVLFQKFYR